MVNPLLLELLNARTLADVPGLRACLIRFGLPQDGPRLWGLADVEADERHYQPVARGTPALIAAAYEALSIVDLVAISMRGQHALRTRLGVAAFLGGDNIDLADEEGWPLFLLRTGWSWIRNRCRGAVVIDWRLAPYRLMHLRGIACETPALAARVQRAFERPLPLPDLSVQPHQEIRHAA